MKHRKSPFSAVTHWVLVFTAALLLTACGTDNTFRINGKINNFGTGNLRIVYLSNNAVQSVVAPAVDDKFSMTGVINSQVFARVYTGNGTIVGRFAVSPGETIEATFSIGSPAETHIKGNDSSERLVEFLHAHADDIKNNNTIALNSAIDKYVCEHSQNLEAAILLTDFYYTKGNEKRTKELINTLDENIVAITSANALLDMIQPLCISTDSIKVKPLRLFTSKDTVSEFDLKSAPKTLLMITNAGARKSDSITATVKKMLPDVTGGKFDVIDISCDTDTAIWHKSLNHIHAIDSTNGKLKQHITRCWSTSPYNLKAFAPATAAQIPWFIVTDSTTHMLYNGASITKAYEILKTAPK